jgi:hypothetical protein
MTDSAYEYAPDIAERRRRPLLTALFVLYATLGILAITIPQNLVNWLGDFKPSPVQEKLLKLAEELKEQSSRAGIDRPYKHIRDFFLSTTGKDPD